jgi:hypothetical protein
MAYMMLEQDEGYELVLGRKLLSELQPVQQQLLWPTSWLLFMRQLDRDLGEVGLVSQNAAQALEGVSEVATLCIPQEGRYDF